MNYILIGTADNRTLYQEVERGTVQRICDMDGNTVPDLSVANWVIDEYPTQPSWALPDSPVMNPPAPTVISRLEFRNRFTMLEKESIYSLAETNVLVRIWLDDLTNSEYVDTNSAITVNGVNNLHQMGLITETRVEEILHA